MHFAYRDHRLKSLISVEFKNMFHVRKMTKTDKEWHDKEIADAVAAAADPEECPVRQAKRGRPSVRYMLRSPHPLWDSHIIVKKAKWGESAFAGLYPIIRVSLCPNSTN